MVQSSKDQPSANANDEPLGHEEKVDAKRDELSYSQDKVAKLAKLEITITKQLDSLNNKEEAAKKKGDKIVAKEQAKEEKAAAKSDKFTKKMTSIEKQKMKIRDQEANKLTKQEAIIGKAEQKEKAAYAKLDAAKANSEDPKKLDKLQDTAEKRGRDVAEEKAIHACLPEKNRLAISKLDIEKDKVMARLAHNLSKISVAKRQAAYDRDITIAGLQSNKARTFQKKSHVQARLADEKNRCQQLEMEFNQLIETPDKPGPAAASTPAAYTPATSEPAPNASPNAPTHEEDNGSFKDEPAAETADHSKAEVEPSVPSTPTVSSTPADPSTSSAPPTAAPQSASAPASE